MYLVIKLLFPWISESASGFSVLSSIKSPAHRIARRNDGDLSVRFIAFNSHPTQIAGGKVDPAAVLRRHFG